MTSEIQKWADPAMYSAEPQPGTGPEHSLVRPRVHLVSMTRNPLRVMAAAAEMYRGRVVYAPDEIPRAIAVKWFQDIQRTTLKAALEFIDLHFLIEGVTRAFTHQLVRQRTAVYVQESLRFAVKDNAAFEVAVPPSIAHLPDDHPWRVSWEHATGVSSGVYNALINAGVPAEDARGLLPTNITTRIHYKTNLRALQTHAGTRLSSQAQWEWKTVWAEMYSAIRSYGPNENRWQQNMICDLFRPVCFTTGKCEFQASTDRYCVIRERVQAHYAAGDPPETWTDIDPAEVFAPDAARERK